MQVYLCCYCFFGFYVVVLGVFSYIVFKCSTVDQAFIMTIVVADDYSAAVPVPVCDILLKIGAIM